MCELRGILQRCRISGFTLDYTKTMLSAVFADGDQEPELTIPNDCAWPPVPPPDTDSIYYYSSLNATSAEPGSFFGLRLHHSRSFAETFEEEIDNRYSTYSNYTATSGNESSESGRTLTDHVRQFPPGRERTISNSSTHGPSANSSLDPSTPRFQHLQPGEIMVTRTFEITSRTRTPSPKRCSTPKSPNTLNQMNERDPAFVRTLNAIKSQSVIEANEQDPAFIRIVKAMRSNSQTDTPPVASDTRPLSLVVPSNVAMIESPAQRSASSMSPRPNDTTGIVRRKYLSFMDRLRGLAEA